MHSGNKGSLNIFKYPEKSKQKPQLQGIMFDNLNIHTSGILANSKSKNLERLYLCIIAIHTDLLNLVY